MTEVNGTPVWTAHPETGVAQAIAALIVEFYKKVDNRKHVKPRLANLPAIICRTVGKQAREDGQGLGLGVSRCCHE